MCYFFNHNLKKNKKKKCDCAHTPSIVIKSNPNSLVKQKRIYWFREPNVG